MNGWQAHEILAAGIFIVLAWLALGFLVSWVVANTVCRFAVWLPAPWLARRGYLAVRIDRIIDGDTVAVVGAEERGLAGVFRIAGIDAPDAHSWQGARSTKILTTLAPPGRAVWVKVRGKDRWARQVVDLWIGFIPVGSYMVWRLAACRWSGKGPSPLTKWWRPTRWIIGPPG